MKKIIKVLGVVALVGSFGTFANAQSTTVTSVNVVGFQTQGVTSNDFQMYSLPFVAMSSDEMGEIFTNQLSSGNTPSLADNVLFWNPALQVYEINWLSPIGWLVGGSPTTNTVPLARAFWVKSNLGTDQALTFSGEVVTNATIAQSLVQGFNMVSYPYNTSLSVTNTALDALSVSGNTPALADNIIKWDSASQAYVTYWLSPIGWLIGGSPAVPDLSMGEGFWFVRRTVGTVVWTETVPYSL